MNGTWNANGLQITFARCKDKSCAPARLLRLFPNSRGRAGGEDNPCSALTVSLRTSRRGQGKGRLKRHVAKGTGRRQHITQVRSEFWGPELHLNLQRTHGPPQFEPEAQLFQIFATGKDGRPYNNPELLQAIFSYLRPCIISS